MLDEVIYWVMQLSIMFIVIYFMLFVTYWKWVIVRKFLFTEQQRQDQDVTFKWIFSKVLWLFNIKHTNG